MLNINSATEQQNDPNLPHYMGPAGLFQEACGQKFHCISIVFFKPLSVDPKSTS